MKSKKVISKVVSIILVISMFTLLTACGEKTITDNFVEYTDPNNGVSYTYNSAYLLSTGDEEAMTEFKDFSTDFYESVKADNEIYKGYYPDTQYYVVRNAENKIDYSCSTFYFLDAGKMFGDIKMSELSDSVYSKLVENIKMQLTVNGNIADPDTSNKYLTFGENEFLHVKINFRSGDNKMVYEQFLLQLDNGNVVNFVLNCYEDEYENAYAQVSKVLESVKVN